jgi:hypothetical protein
LAFFIARRAKELDQVSGSLALATGVVSLNIPYVVSSSNSGITDCFRQASGNDSHCWFAVWPEDKAKYSRCFIVQKLIDASRCAELKAMLCHAMTFRF